MSANAQQQRPLCRYFASNICFKGDNCEFSHDRNAKPDLVCRYYLQGACAYGSRCRFLRISRVNFIRILGLIMFELMQHKKQRFPTFKLVHLKRFDF